MARQVLTKTTLTRTGWPTDGVSITWTAADAANKDEFTLTGKEVVLARNTDSVNAETVTINSVAINGRTGDITADSIAADGMAVYGPFNVDGGWAQTDGTLHLEASSSDVEFAVLVLP